MGRFSGVRNWIGNIFNAERDRNGNVTYTFLEGDDFINSEKYLDKSFDNPVLATIIALRCKIFSQMEITHLDRKGNIIENSPYVALLKTPNYFQSQEDFLFQLMWFQSAAGTNLAYQKKAFSNSVPSALYNLVPSEIDLNKTHKIGKFIVTKKEIAELSEKVIKYKLDNQNFDLKLGDIIPFYDLSNGLTTNSFMKSPSRVKGIMRSLENIEQNLKSKNINLQMSQKYLASNKTEPTRAQIQPEDRSDIERKLATKSLHISNFNIEVKHLVSDFKKLFLDEMFSNDALTCLLAFEMSRDVLNYFSNGASTHENQNQAMLNYLQNSTSVDAKSTMNSFSQQWGLFEKGEKLKASYDHLPIMQPVMLEKIKTFREYQETLKLGIENKTITESEAKAMSNALKGKLGL